MAGSLDFEGKVGGLQEYYHDLQELNPRDRLHGAGINREIFYDQSEFDVSRGIIFALQSVMEHMRNHGTAEYAARGLGARELREESAEERYERADVLSVMTAPMTPAVRDNRTRRIAAVLNVLTGADGNVLWSTCNNHGEVDSTEVVVDSERPLYAVLASLHSSCRTLRVQYDTHEAHSPFFPSENLMVSVDVPGLFSDATLAGKPTNKFESLGVRTATT